MATKHKQRFSAGVSIFSKPCFLEIADVMLVVSFFCVYVCAMYGKISKNFTTSDLDIQDCS